MKHLFILLLSIACGQILYAQASKKTNIAYYHHKQFLLQLLQQQQHNNNNDALRTTNGIATERVIAQSTRDSTLVTLTDSVNLKYNLLRGSTYDYNDMDYAYNYPYSASPMFNYAGVFTSPQVLYDTFIHWTDDPFTLTYGLYEFCYAGYDSSTSDLLNYKHIFVDSTTNQNMSYINTFTAANNIASGYWFNLNLGLADSAYKQFFTYNSSNALIKDSTYEYHLGAWYLVSRTLYTYVGSNLTQIDNYVDIYDTTFTLPLLEQIQYINTYDASNRLLTVLENYNDSTTIAPYVTDTFAYSGTRTYHDSWREYQYDPINGYWAPQFNMTKSANALGLPDTINVQGFDSLANSWIPQTMYIASYDISNDPDTLKEYDYNYTAFPTTPSFTTIYYYQTFYNTTETNNVSTINDRVLLYPNPAANTITISQLNVQENSVLSISMINANGQMASRETIPAQSELQISVTDLIPGVYWIMIQDETGKLLYRQAVVKNKLF